MFSFLSLQDTAAMQQLQIDDYNHAIITGIVKIAAKMGISTIQSYQGSKIFDCTDGHELRFSSCVCPCCQV